MIFTELAPRLIQSIVRNVHSKNSALKQLWSVTEYNCPRLAVSFCTQQGVKNNYSAIDSNKENEIIKQTFIALGLSQSLFRAPKLPFLKPFCLRRTMDRMELALGGSPITF